MRNTGGAILLIAAIFISLFSAAQTKDTLRALERDQEFYKLGCKLADSAKYKDAIKLFQKAIKENTVFHQAYNKIAYCKVQLGDLKGAEKDLEKSLKIYPEDGATLKYLGYVYMEDQKFNEAKMYLDSASKMLRDDFELEYYMATLKYIGRDYKGSLANLEKSIELRANYGDAWLKRGLIYSKMKEYKFAVRDLTRGLELNAKDSSNMEVFRARAAANFELGDFNGAIQDYTRIIQIDPKNEEAYTHRGASKIEIGDNSGAIDDETKAIDLNKNSYMAYNLRGVAKGGLKTYGEAIKDLDQAIKLKVDFASAYVNRASVKYAMNEKKKACDDLYKADQLGSNIAYRYIEKFCKGLTGQK